MAVGEPVSGEALTGALVEAVPDVGESEASVGLLRATTGELTGASIGVSVGAPVMGVTGTSVGAFVAGDEVTGFPLGAEVVGLPVIGLLLGLPEVTVG